MSTKNFNGWSDRLLVLSIMFASPLDLLILAAAYLSAWIMEKVGGNE